MKTKISILVSLVTTALLASPWSVHGHGTMADPISRAYQVFLEGPEAPKSAAAKAAVALSGTQAFYDWNEVSQNIPTYNYPSLVPDGQLPGAGRTKYAGLNLARADWPATQVKAGPRPARFVATAVHEPSFFRTFLTREGFDPRLPLKWSDLEEIPGGETAKLSGKEYFMTLQLPPRKGRHILYVVWQRIDPVGEVFFSTCDLDYGGVDYGSAPAPVTPPPAVSTPPATTNPTNSPTPVTPPTGTKDPCCCGTGCTYDPATGTGSCACGDCYGSGGNPNDLPSSGPVTAGVPVRIGQAEVTFTITNEWPKGMEAGFRIKNVSDTELKNWSLAFDWPVTISNLWNGQVSRGADNRYTVTPTAWNGQIPPGGVVEVGLIATMEFTGLRPAHLTMNGVGGAPLPVSPPVVAAPVITSATSASGEVGKAFTYAIVASGSPTRYTATGLPTGLVLNATNGVISGTPAAAGTNAVVLGAVNAGGTGTANLSVRVAPAPVAPPPTPAGQFTVTHTVSSDWGSGYTASVTIRNLGTAAVKPWTLEMTFDGQMASIWNATSSKSGNVVRVVPASWNESLPAGGSVSFGYNGAPGTQQKIPVNFRVNGTAVGGTPPAPTPVTPPPATVAAPVITSATSAAGQVSQAFAFTVTASGRPTTYSALGLPAGLSLNSTSGAISGTPTSAGVFAVTVQARNAGGTGSGLLTLTIAAAPVVTPAPTPNPAPLNPGVSSGRKVVAYFPSWGIYEKGYTVAQIPASRLTHVIHAFARISPAGEIELIDTWADLEKPFGPDTWDTPLRGNFGAYQRLKAAHPHLRVLIAVGGWFDSGRFSTVAATAEARSKFAKSVRAFVVKYGLDGVDLDWEYPVVATDVNTNVRPEDGVNYARLAAAIRAEFNAQQALDKRKYEITAALPAGYQVFEKIDLAALARELDFVNLMSYDFHGRWIANQTGYNAPLYAAANAPERRFTADGAVTGMIAMGVPAAKIVLGVPSYGYGWKGVRNELTFSPAAGVGPGTLSVEPGFYDYRTVADLVKANPVREKWDAVAQTSFYYDGDLWISYDSPRALRAKLGYIGQKGLGGVMFWEASTDVRDNSAGTQLMKIAAEEMPK
jgi:chitinase